MKAEFTYQLINKIGKIQAEMRKAKDAGAPVPKARNNSDAELYQLIAADKEFEIRDDAEKGVKGLILRVQPTGKMVYSLVYTRGKRKTLGPADSLDHHQARERAKKIKADFHLNGEPEKNANTTYLEFLDNTYRPWLKQNVKQPTMAYDSLKKSFPEFHELPLTKITHRLIEEWKIRRLQEVKPSTVNRQLDDLRACLNRAVEWGILKENPTKNVKRKKTDRNAKVRYLSDDEERELRLALDAREQEIKAERQSANKWRAERGHPLLPDLQDLTYIDHLKPAVLVTLNTGLRRGELLKLKWENVDFDQRNLTIVGETAKEGKTKHIPLNDEALSVLKAWKAQLRKDQTWKDQAEIKNKYVFAGTEEFKEAEEHKPMHDMRSSWKNVLIKAKITDFRWHDMRHSFASNLVMAGVDLNTVRELLGHSDYKMTLRYSHLAPEHKAAAVAKLVTAKSVRSTQNSTGKI